MSDKYLEPLKWWVWVALFPFTWGLCFAVSYGVQRLLPDPFHQIGAGEIALRATFWTVVIMAITMLNRWRAIRKAGK